MRPMKPRKPGSAYDALARGIAEIGLKARGNEDLGVHVVAAFEGCSVGTLYKQLDPDQRDEFPFTRVARLTEHFSIASLAEDLAQRAGGVFVALPEVVPAAADLDGFCSLVKEAGEAIAATAAARADGEFTAEERVLVRQQLRELIEAAVAFDGWLTSEDVPASDPGGRQ